MSTHPDLPILPEHPERLFLIALGSRAAQVDKANLALVVVSCHIIMSDESLSCRHGVVDADPLRLLWVADPRLAKCPVAFSHDASMIRELLEMASVPRR